MRFRTSVAVGAVVLSLLGGTTACRGDVRPTPAVTARALTTAEAETLALVRFRNYRAGLVRGTVTAPDPGAFGAEVLVDFRRHLAVARMHDDGAAPSLLAWDGSRVWVTAERADPFTGSAPPVDAWGGAALNPTTPADLFLALVLQLAADRPENPQLLAQSSARFLRTTTVDGQPLRIFAGPDPAGKASGKSRTTYWVDADGDLVRFEAALGPQGQRFVLDLDHDARPGRMPAVVARLSAQEKQ